MQAQGDLGERDRAQGRRNEARKIGRWIEVRNEQMI